MERDDYTDERVEMVAVIAGTAAELAPRLGKDGFDPAVMRTLLKVRRHAFVPDLALRFAYANTPVPIGHGKTISQPFIVALMTDLLDLQPEDRVLEIGTGLGYQAAVLSALARSVFTVEIVEELGRDAARRLAAEGCSNIRLRVGDGSRGWADEAPFDKILVAAAPEMIPALLIHQLRPGGRMVIPAGDPENQELLLLQKDARGRTRSRAILPVRFLPLELPPDDDDD